MDSQKFSFLILGGCGFIGRHFVQFLLDNDLANAIRIVDKVIPQLAYLNDQHVVSFNNPVVEFVNANLLSKSSIEKAFSNDLPFDYVINCAGETKSGLTDPIYEEGILNLSVNCAKFAAEKNVKRYVEISSGAMASNSKEPHKESDPTEPWTPIAKYKLKVESELATIPNLNYTILRPAIVYGIGDKTGISPRLVFASIYQHMNETLKLLWSPNLYTNTIHVLDLCRAIWFVIQKSEALGQVYNVVDAGNTNQGYIGDIISGIFKIQHTYIDGLVSALYKLDLDSVLEEINEKHSLPWAELLEKNNITNTPLSSYLHKDDISNKHLNLDGTKLSNIGFRYLVHPKINAELIQEIIEDYSSRKMFPALKNT